jgi:chromosome segregation ATPase
MDERPPEKVAPQVLYREILWEDWLSERKEELARLQGQLQALPNRPTTIDWDINPMARERELLQTIIDPLWKDVRKLKGENEALKKALEKRDTDITDILVKTKNWIDHYQPLLDEMEKEKKQLKKVRNK